MKRLPPLIRSIAALVAALVAISVLVELIELALIVAVNGGMPAGEDQYFAVRNRPVILAAKFLYNAAGGFAGGLLVARIAGRRPVAHGVTLAAIQGALLVWAMLHPQLGRTAPLWAWVAFALTTCAGIVGGAMWVSRRRVTQ